METVYFAFPGNEKLCQSLIKTSNSSAGKFDLRSFPDGESYVRIYSPVKNKKTVIVCSLNQPNTKLTPLFLVAKTLKSLGAAKVILIAPYLAYMRQDKVFHEGEGISSHYIAEFFSGFIDGLITIDPHLHRIKQLNEIYKIPTKVGHAAKHIAQWIKNNVPQALLIGPDSESEQWVQEVAKNAGVDYTILEKIRKGDNEVSVSMPSIEKYTQHTPVLVDDIISTGRTMIETISHLKNLKMKAPVCIVIHPVFTNRSYEELLLAGASKIVSCNTIAHESNAIDISDLLQLSV